MTHESRQIRPAIEVLVSPYRRIKHIVEILKLEGLPSIPEDERAAYCPISLASVPNELKDYVTNHQNMLLSVLKEAGITGYDPNTAPFSPDMNKDVDHTVVYATDMGKVACSRFLAGFNILPSTGFGEELDMGSHLNRIIVMFMKKGLRLTRMLPPRAIYLTYDNFEQEAIDFVEIFKELKTWSPGMGFKDGKPIMLGFKEGRVVDLSEEIYRLYPCYKYVYNPNNPMLEFHVSNPELLTKVK